MRELWEDVRSLVIGAFVIGAWITTLLILLSTPLAALPVWLLPLGILWMTFLYTGLFITAHDAMHGSLCRGHPQVNLWIGRIVVFAYAMLP
jgi:beta-carotene/zeaxanthin 4-ketolase